MASSSRPECERSRDRRSRAGLSSGWEARHAHHRRHLARPPAADARGPGDPADHERAREALFGILEHGAPPLRGARFLDLFCGTGAIGLEAASRGAAEVLLIDRRRPGAEARAGEPRAYRRAGERPAGGARCDPPRPGAPPYDLVFLDPP